MIFSELYGAYYTAVARIIEKAIEKPLQKDELRSIAEKYAFGESAISIEHALLNERWQLIDKDGQTPIENVPTMPLTTLQKRWLKAISLDPRIKLFEDELPGLEGVKPLFTPDDIVVFDKYSDGDPYEDEEYIRNFRLILDALRNRYPLKIVTFSRKEKQRFSVVMPEYMEYSEKDDKFRLICSGHKHRDTINLGRITYCEPYDQEFIPRAYTRMHSKQRTVQFQLVDERNALERVLLHFAHFEKRAERIDDNRYIVSITYDKDDETELLIRILSFGPVLRVTCPERFINLIKERLISQKKL